MSGCYDRQPRLTWDGPPGRAPRVIAVPPPAHLAKTPAGSAAAEIPLQTFHWDFDSSPRSPQSVPLTFLASSYLRTMACTHEQSSSPKERLSQHLNFPNMHSHHRSRGLQGGKD